MGGIGYIRLDGFKARHGVYRWNGMGRTGSKQDLEIYPAFSFVLGGMH